jgi:hypothetical protein
VHSAGALLPELSEAPTEGMLLGATGGEMRATGVVAQRVGMVAFRLEYSTFQPASCVARAAKCWYSIFPMGVDLSLSERWGLAALGPAAGTM